MCEAEGWPAKLLLALTKVFVAARQIKVKTFPLCTSRAHFHSEQSGQNILIEKRTRINDYGFVATTIRWDRLVYY